MQNYLWCIMVLSLMTGQTYAAQQQLPRVDATTCRFFTQTYMRKRELWCTPIYEYIGSGNSHNYEQALAYSQQLVSLALACSQHINTDHALHTIRNKEAWLKQRAAKKTGKTP